MRRHLTRRDFFKAGSVGLGTAVLAGCQRPPQWVILEPYVRPPEEQITYVASWYASTCRQCPAGCGIIVRIMNGRAVKIEGNPQHPLNQGKLCPRGQAGLQLLYNPDRLAGPVKQNQRGSRQFERITWEAGLQVLADKIQSSGNRIAVWLGSRVTESLYNIFSLLSKATNAPPPLVYDLYSGFNGYHAMTADLETAYGTSGLPAYNTNDADVVFSFGANIFGPWLSAVRYGVDYGKFRSQPFGQRGYLVQFEPRLSITGAKSDYWVPIKPGTEALVAQALIQITADNGFGSAQRVATAKSFATNVDVNAAAAASDVSTDILVKLARLFAEAEHPVAIAGLPSTGSETGNQALNPIWQLNEIVANQDESNRRLLLPASLPDGITPVTYSSIQDVNRLIQQMGSGAIDLLLVHGANPIFELPPGTGIADAIKKVPSVISFAPIVDETAVWADVILPDNTYLESWGYSVPSPDFAIPMVGSQQPVVQPYFDTRSTGDILLAIAKNIPVLAPALPWPNEFELVKARIKQLGRSLAGGLGDDVFFARFQQNGVWYQTAEPNLATLSSSVSPGKPASPSYQGDAGTYPYHLHLYLSDFLSDGKGAAIPWLQGSPDPMTTIAWQTWVEINPATAAKLGVAYGDVVKVTSPFGEIEALVYIYPTIRTDTVAIPIGQGHTDYGRYARDRGANPVALLGGSSPGGEMDWELIRVNIAPTGKHTFLATFENTFGVIHGLINEEFPGK